RANFDVLGLVQRFHHPGDGGKRRHDHHFDRRHVANFEQQIFDELRGLSLQHVHLPVSSDDFFSHNNIMVIPSEAEGSRRATVKVTTLRIPRLFLGLTWFIVCPSVPPPRAIPFLPIIRASRRRR